jgi:hypothetical protein
LAEMAATAAAALVSEVMVVTATPREVQLALLGEPPEVLPEPMIQRILPLEQAPADWQEPITPRSRRGEVE